jgi:hypothetical protein
VVRLLLAVVPSVLAPLAALLPLVLAESLLVMLRLRMGKLQPLQPLLLLHLPVYLRVLRPAWRLLLVLSQRLQLVRSRFLALRDCLLQLRQQPAAL